MTDSNKQFDRLLLDLLGNSPKQSTQQLPVRKPQKPQSPPASSIPQSVQNDLGFRSEDFDSLMSALTGGRSAALRREKAHVMELGEEPMVDKTLIDFVKKWEGFKPTAYKPLAHDKWTIGYGRTTGVKEGDKMDEPTALKHLIDELNIFETDVKKLINKNVLKSLTKDQLSSITSLVYNVGTGAFSRSKALKHLNAGDFAGFKKEAFDPEIGFVKSGGKVVKGLVNRRLEEQKLFEKGEKKK